VFVFYQRVALNFDDDERKTTTKNTVNKGLTHQKTILCMKLLLHNFLTPQDVLSLFSFALFVIFSLVLDHEKNQ